LPFNASNAGFGANFTLPAGNLTVNTSEQALSLELLHRHSARARHVFIGGVAISCAGAMLAFITAADNSRMLDVPAVAHGVKVRLDKRRLVRAWNDFRSYGSMTFEMYNLAAPSALLRCEL
jgi:hypothetical protein